METRVFEIGFLDGSIFRIYCANKAQIKRFMKAYQQVKDQTTGEPKEINSGVHTVEQFEKLIKSNF